MTPGATAQKPAAKPAARPASPAPVPVRAIRPAPAPGAPVAKPLAPEGGRVVRVSKGDQPPHSSLTALQQWSWRTFRSRVARTPIDPSLDENLLKAHMRIRGDEYIAYVMGMTLIIGIALAVVGALIAVLLAVTGAGLVAVVGLLIPALGTPMVFLILKSRPSGNAKSRGTKINNKISASMSFVSAMASADVNIDQIFKELARQEIYGEVAQEAAWITRDTELLGVDILTAIKSGAIRTPSKRFQDFLQGVVTTATSGGQLKPYFLVKAEQYERENKLERLQKVETMGLLAETFVTVVVAFPLFLVIIIAIFAIIGGGGAFLLEILWAIVGLMIPMSQFGFVFFIYSLASEL